MATPTATAAQQQLARAQLRFAQAQASRNPLAIAEASQGLGRATRRYRERQKPPSSKPTPAVSPRVTMGPEAIYPQPGVKPKPTIGKMVDQPQPATVEDKLRLINKYKIQNDQYNLEELYRSGTQTQKDIAFELFKVEDTNYARLAALPGIKSRPGDVAAKYGRGAVPGERYESGRDYRPMAPIPLQEYIRLSETEKLFHYVDEAVDPSFYASVGEGTRHGAGLRPEFKIRHGLTPFKEEEGETWLDFTATVPRYIGEGLDVSRGKLSKKLGLDEPQPSPFDTVGNLKRMRGQVVQGAFDLASIPVQFAGISFATGGYIGQKKPGEAGQLVWDTGGGIKDWFVAIPGEVKGDPTKIGYYGIMLAPMGVSAARTGARFGTKVVKGARSWFEPHGAPPRAYSVEAGIARADLGAASKAEALDIMGEVISKQVKGEIPASGMRGTATVDVSPGKSVKVDYRLSPAQKTQPNVLYHATSDATAMLKGLQSKGHIEVKGSLFTSPQAASQFLARTSIGGAPLNPGVFAIRVPPDVVAKIKAKTPYKTWKGAVENEVVLPESIRLYNTDINSYARATGKSGEVYRQYVDAKGNYRHEFVKRDPAITGETFTTYRGQPYTAKAHRMRTPEGEKVVYTLDKKVSMTPGTKVPVYWLRAKGATGGAPSPASLYALTLKAFSESVLDVAETVGGAVADMARLRVPRALKRPEITYDVRGMFAPMGSPFRLTTKAYSDIKIIARAIEADAAKAMRKAEKSGKKADYAQLLDEAASKRINELLKEPKIRELIESNPRLFDETFKVNLAKHMTLFRTGELESSHKGTEPTRVSDVEYRYDPETKELTRVDGKDEGREGMKSERERDTARGREGGGVGDDEGREGGGVGDDEKGKGAYIRRKSDIVVKEVKGKPPKGERGSVSWNQGVVRITITPPYREGSQDIHYERRDPPVTGKGSPQSSIKVTRGTAPEVIELGMGVSRVTIKNGKSMVFGPQQQPRGPGLLLPNGRLVKQKRGSVLS